MLVIAWLQSAVSADSYCFLHLDCYFWLYTGMEGAGLVPWAGGPLDASFFCREVTVSLAILNPVELNLHP